ncbi:MAG TPA: HAD family phosphatase [Candidatus Saccharimonadales bacterium]|nr:HAD family phosphatase [Candidatus Saccharimonadales bacterium]
MNKAFLFDLDGVLINDEAIWEERKQRMYPELFGKDVHKKLGSTLGSNIDDIYARATAAGTDVSKEKFVNEFYKLAGDVYSTAPIPDGTAELAEELVSMGYKLGVVSASPLSWITTVTKRLPFENDIELIISLMERDDLKHKPHPDGYLEAMKALGSSPETTIILEDSNPGIESAKASGSFTIGLKQNLAPAYVQEGADAYADTMIDVIELVKSRH